MSTTKELKVLPFIKGCQIRLLSKEDEAEDSADKYLAEASYDGEPDSEVFYVAPHWHKYHDEYMSVTEGRLEVTVEGITRIVSAGDEPAFIPRWHVHSMKGFQGEKVVFQEKAVPAGPTKALFFNDLLSQGPDVKIPHALRVFWDGDTYPSLPGNIKLLDQIFILILGGMAKVILFWDRRPKHF